ncbi:insulinase family protein [Oxalobacteraceae bacterium OM1]|nr:insulinase family protein [Oxalobacteraceae bacterium OM1]
MIKRIFLLVCFIVVAPAEAALKIQTWSLANGTRVLFVESHSIPVVDLAVEFDAGSRRDPQGKAGTAALTNAMLARGIQGAEGPAQEQAMTEAQISDTFADTGAQRGGGAGNDRAGASLRTLSSKTERDTSVSLLARVLAQPSFPADFLQRDKARMIAAIKEDETKPEAIANKAFWRLLYGPHPYAKQETVESVTAITREDLVEFHRRHYVANRAIVSIIGDLSRADADAIAQQLTVRLPQGEPLPELPNVVVQPAREERIQHPASQAHILLGEPALKRGDAEYFSLIVGNYVLGGGGFVSRLMNEVRERRGLTYGVYSYFNPLAQPGPFEIGLTTKKEQAAEALKVVRSVLEGFLRDGPTPAELKAAKDNLVGGFALRIDNNKKILDNIAAIGFYKLPLDYLDTWTAKVEKVTADDVKIAFRRKISPEQLSLVIVGDVK